MQFNKNHFEEQFGFFNHSVRILSLRYFRIFFLFFCLFQLFFFMWLTVVVLFHALTDILDFTVKVTLFGRWQYARAYMIKWEKESYSLQLLHGNELESKCVRTRLLNIWLQFMCSRIYLTYIWPNVLWQW